ncbi:hypothetical protein EIP91_010616 [Steccherinum ochraceum]|uniref:Uncharacterized protein n=1 Tax=Steccherinum ochraceum TaxID=92696 RepID=A0A4R0R8A2_9APHY|nr:hypothetical protein EIP91_010616 [Steccherinum ochraceum]
MEPSTGPDATSAARGFASSHERQEEATTQATQTPEQAATPVGITIKHKSSATYDLTLTVEKAPPSLQLPPQQVYSISTAFHADFLVDDKKPDVVLISSDRVLFYAHQSFLLSVSNNTFNGLLSIDAIGTIAGSTAGSLCVVVPVGSVLFNVALHTIYGMSCQQFKPPFDMLLQAVQILKTFGIAIDQFLGRDTPLYNHIVAETPPIPIEVFLVAAENNLDALAVATSAHLHSLGLSKVTEEMAVRMGPTYFKRLMWLHMERTGYLEQLLLVAPRPHEDTAECGMVERRGFNQAWTLAVGNLMWTVRPDMPVDVLRSTLCSIEQRAKCNECKRSLHARVQDIVVNWSTNAKY